MTPTRFYFVSVLALVLAGCSDTRRDPDAAAAGAEPAPEVQAAVAEIGEEAAQALRAGLLGRLTAAIQEGGPEAAIDVCAREALPLTDSIARAGAGDMAVKRTALRLRNPANAPDALELAALQWFEEHDAERPSYLVQADGNGYRYNAPLRIAAICTNCHGPADALSEGVRAALDRQYPDDAAVGYAEGELRGIIRVSVPASRLTPRGGTE